MSPGGNDSDLFKRWFDRLQERDPTLHEELTRRLEARVKARPGDALTEQEGLILESVADPTTTDNTIEFALETIVREGRPAFSVQGDRIVEGDIDGDPSAAVVRQRLIDARPVLEPLLPLVGRIDAVNHPRNLPFLGTAWLVAPGIAVTNRHVANLMARRDGGAFVFQPGLLGERLDVNLDFKHEMGSDAVAAVRVLEVLFIEGDDEKRPDIAFIRVEDNRDGLQPRHFEFPDLNAAPNTDVAVIGYPARAPAYVIPDQAWMDRIYGGTYEVKRIAPGLMLEDSRGWATHDCTTLGGNSGSVVVDMASGKAVGLHFAGLYMIENYAVPASTIARYLKDPPWNAAGGGSRDTLPDARPEKPSPPSPPPASATGRSSTITLPLTLTVTLGDPVGGDVSVSIGVASSDLSIEAAARALFTELRDKGALAVRPGHPLSAEGIEDRLCLIVAAAPDRIAGLAAPAEYRGWPVEIRAASLRDQAASEAPLATEAVSSIAYNDSDRVGAGFSFDWVEEEMDVVCHVGPERSWSELKSFLGATKRSLVSSIYEFHARYIADAIHTELGEGASLKLVMARQSRDPKSGEVGNTEFPRAATFAQWESEVGARFDHAFVPIGRSGLCANAYHIKVSVRDDDTVWLSSGNWRATSQPMIRDPDLNNPAATIRAGNREWHAIVRSPALAARFANHIKADYEFSVAHAAASPEAIEDELMVDVPLAALQEAIELEAPPGKVLESLRASRKIRVKPLLTPDKEGAVYCDAVLDLIKSARHQLVLQNQYIHASATESGRLGALIDAVVDRAKHIDDCRIILRREGDGLAEDVSELKRRGFPVATGLRAVGKTHTKGIVVDGKRVLIGSHNWSPAGVTLNRDASLIFDDPEIARFYLEAFELDWNRATPVSLASIATEAPRLAVGDTPPPGFVRMPLSEYLEG